MRIIDPFCGSGGLFFIQNIEFSSWNDKTLQINLIDQGDSFSRNYIIFAHQSKIMEQNLTEEEMIEHSKKYPRDIFTAENGKIVFQGMLFENRKEFDDFLLLGKNLQSPVFRLIVKILTFFSKTFGRKKK